MVSVIIINYNTFELTAACIRSVYRYTKGVPFELILVDNASTECNADQFLIEFPQLTLIKSPVNGGFAAGNNLGIAAAKGTHYLLLNSDTLLTEDSIAKSHHFLLSQEKAGVVGCRQLFPDGKVQYVARKFRSISWELLDLFRFIIYRLPYEKRSQLMLGQFFKNDTSCEADWVNGAFFMMPAQVVRELPGQQLDDRFFMYGEDVLWSEQIKQLGYKVFFFAGTSIIHIASASTAFKKQLQLRKLMVKHECAIMALRKGRGLYYVIFCVLYVSKEYLRYLIKWLVFSFTGKLIK
ncbi:MAG: glycosyltransferase family 2 protein [Sphingomonadales bacterium]